MRFGAFGFVAFALMLCPPAVQAARVESAEPFEGVKHYHLQTTSPRLLNIHIMEIDLSASGIGFFVTAPLPGFSDGRTAPQTTPNFVNQQNAQLGVNGDFYSFTGSNTLPSGFAASNGNIYRPFNAQRPALNIGADNLATVVRNSGAAGGQTPLPNVPVFNAVSGDTWLVRDGVAINNSTGHHPQLHPRTAAGITADNKLLLAAIDGRDATHSNGMTSNEVADLLMSYGAINALNLDGGGSTTMVIRDPTVRVLNKPSDGTPRAVGNNLAVFASAVAQPRGTGFVYADFYAGDRGTFTLAPGFSGSSGGIVAAQSTNVALQMDDGRWAQRLQIVNNPSQGSAQNPGGGWFVRHNSGSSAARAQNHPRPTSGYVGLWAMTTDPGVWVSIAIDNEQDVTADRGIARPMIADGTWRLYQWSLEDDSQWEPWVNGDGRITPNSTFTIDSIQFFGPHADATIYIDSILHHSMSPLPEPAAALSLVAFALLSLRRRTRSRPW